jgi:transcriptional regulator with XRE-family HTH domain
MIILVVRGKAVTTTQTLLSKGSLGSKAKKLRLASLLTRSGLASIAGVTAKEVSLFERGLPVRLDSRRLILKALWAKKTEK